MTARTGMANIILHVRGLANAGTADWTLGTAVYWDDDHVQEMLDRRRVEFYRMPLGKVQQYEGGTVVYKIYRSGMEYLESGTTVFEVEDAAGNTVGTALYTPNYNNGEIVFASDTGGSSYYLTGRSYQANKAAADIWRMKAANVAAYYDFKTDNHSMSRSQMVKQFLQMADYFDSQSGVMSVDMYRGDDVA